jgi:hypothetical protein
VQLGNRSQLPSSNKNKKGLRLHPHLRGGGPEAFVFEGNSFGDYPSCQLSASSFACASEERMSA